MINNHGESWFIHSNAAQLSNTLPSIIKAVKNHLKRVFLCLALGTLCTPMMPLACLADTVQIEQELSFGEITAHPGGDRIIINASSGPGTPVSENGLSLVTGGANGRLSFTADTGNVGQYVKIVYPGTLTLQCKTDTSETIVIDGFSGYSTTGLTGQTYPQDIYIGGRLTLSQGQEACQYTGTLEITLVY